MNVVNIAKGEIEGTCLHLCADMLIDDELNCSNVLDFTPVVMD